MVESWKIAAEERNTMQRKTFGESGSSDLTNSLSHFRHAVRRVANTLNPSVVVQSTEVDDLAGSGSIHSSDNPPSGQTQTPPIRAESSAKRKLHKISLLSRFRSRPSDGSADDILSAAVNKTNCNGPQVNPFIPLICKSNQILIIIRSLNQSIYVLI